MQIVRNFTSSFGRLWNSKEVLRLSNIRLAYLPYFFAFPLSLIFINIQDNLLVGSFYIFGVSSNTLALIAFAVGATIVLIIRSPENVHIISKISSVITFAGFIPWLFIRQDGWPDFICAIIFLFGIGGCMAASSTHFMLILNNAERFLACTLMAVIIGVVNVNFSFIERHGAVRLAILGVLVIGIAVCMSMVKKVDFKDESKPAKGFDPSIWLSLFILLSYYITRILAFHIPEYYIQLSLPMSNILAVIPILLCVIITLTSQRSVWIMCNVFFVSAILVYLFIFTQDPVIANLFVGMKEIGLLVGFYLCACVVNKFLDFRRHKVMEFICISIIAAAFVVPDLLIGTAWSYIIPIVVTIVLFTVFLLMSPLFSTYLFATDWSREFALLNMSEIKAKVAMSQSDEDLHLEGLKSEVLTPDEVGVALLLIEGKTRSEIIRKLRIKSDGFDNMMDSIRKKVSGVDKPDPVIAAIAAGFGLTNREKDMLGYLMDGATTEQIAAELFIAEETVRVHVSNLMKKLDIEKRQDIVEWVESQRQLV